MLTVTAAHRDAMLATCVRALPEEGCGLLLGDEHGAVIDVIPTRNIAASAALYEVEPKALLTASRRADQLGCDVIGVFHSHTHTDAFPSATDVQQAPDPGWHYVLVSLRLERPLVRSYRIVDGLIDEEPVEIRR